MYLYEYVFKLLLSIQYSYVLVFEIFPYCTLLQYRLQISESTCEDCDTCHISAHVTDTKLNVRVQHSSKCRASAYAIARTSATREAEAARGFLLQLNGLLRRLCAYRDSLIAPEPPHAAPPAAATEAEATARAPAASPSPHVPLDAAIARLERTRALLQLEDGASLSAALAALTSTTTE